MSALVSQFALVFALVAGAVVPMQAGANAALGRNLGHPLWATLVSLSISVLLGLVLLSWLRLPMPNAAIAIKGPFWSWFGGLAGIIYVTSAVVLAPKLGLTTFMAAVVTGQVVISLLLDHYGLLGFAVRPISAMRLLAVAMIVSGVLLLHFSSNAVTK